MCREEIQSERGSGGSDRAGSFSARPRRLWKGLYSQRERGRAMHTLNTLPPILYAALCTHSALFPPSHTTVQTQTHHCHVESRPEGDTNPPRTRSQVCLIPLFISSYFASFHFCFKKTKQKALASFFFFFWVVALVIQSFRPLQNILAVCMQQDYSASLHSPPENPPPEKIGGEEKSQKVGIRGGGVGERTVG